LSAGQKANVLQDREARHPGNKMEFEDGFERRIKSKCVGGFGLRQALCGQQFSCLCVAVFMRAGKKLSCSIFIV